jgi:FKBP-type peptidyl-prolyl cis-trans isomerase
MEMSQGDIMAYLLGLADNKKLKLGGKDLLFLQSAFTAWESKEKDIYIKKVGDNKRTAEDLAKLALEKTPSGLGFQLLKAGKGEAAQNGKTVQVHYRGYLQDGSIFDASFDRAEVFEFPLGQGRVIKGWDEGIAKLKVGDHAILRVPPALGYGSRAMGAAIPANSELIFEVVLMGIK